VAFDITNLMIITATRQDKEKGGYVNWQMSHRVQDADMRDNQG
jgi:hypothetical protein